LFRGLLANDADDVDALNNLAWLLALRDQSKIVEALALIDRAIRVQGPAPSLFDTRAVVLIRAGQFDQALKELSNAKAGNARNPSFALHLAWAYQASGQSDRARTHLQEAEKLGLKPHALDPLESAIFQRLAKALSSG
jgi:cellulose synthase operon protein C